MEGRLENGQYWQGWTVEAPVGVVVFVHGVHEHGGRYAPVAARLGEAGYACYAVDHPGHGRSPGNRGNIDGMDTTVAGVAALVTMAADRHPDVPVFVYGHSLGGLVALTYLTGERHPRVVGAVISAPALDTSASNAVQRAFAPVLSRFLPDLGVLALDIEAVSRDPEVVAAYRADPLNHTGKIVARTGAEILTAATAMPARLRGLTLPLLLVHGGADRLMPVSATEVVRAHAASPDLTVRVFDGLYHEPHNEPEKAEVLTEIVAWLDAHLPPAPA
ncbi:alpha-beta hydrolase superfamily lysophospholipase [Actinocorallia herbida]|uniref:Alpha-beta hydrolase superfamily lysophospholipase n=1 Tax=Actinocorallia herbida TaxID=58109 RepID=A0A3N1CZK8_9ACTN|nr:alpha/beta hydrolase [Actinocorallia herbida]ROO86682.1 alpha-beta hydrolase superfamily lysophospholipase [Actinocorallia herbida]